MSQEKAAYASMGDNECSSFSKEVFMETQNQQRIPGQYGLDEIKANRLAPWPNPHPERDYVTHFEIPEFTCLCPRSGFPDFATIVIDYVPHKYIVELNNLNLYINRYRARHITHASVTN